MKELKNALLSIKAGMPFTIETKCSFRDPLDEEGDLVYLVTVSNKDYYKSAGTETPAPSHFQFKVL